MNIQDDLAIQFQDSNDPRERNRLFKELRKHYLPWVYSKYSEFAPRDREELLALYDMKLLRALELWNRKSLFTTYSYNWVRKAYTETIRLYPKRDKIYSSLEEYEEYEDDY